MSALGQTSFLGAPLQAGQAQSSHATSRPSSVVCSLRPQKKLVQSTRPQQQYALLRQRAARSVRTTDAAAAASVGSGWMDMPESQPLPDQVEVFPRLKEKDPYKLLGVTQEADFEEVQDARNFLVDQYKGHEASREAIELAFERVLSEHMKRRQKGGFRPPQRGKRTDVQGDAQKLSLWQQLREKFEPSVPSTTLVNDGSVFVALALWAAWQAASSDPTLPLGAAICYCGYKLYDKRSRRMGSADPERTPIWGALGTTLLTLVLSGVLSYVVVAVVPLPPRVSAEGLFSFLIGMSLGFAAIFLK